MVKTVQEPAQSKAAGGLVLGPENIKGTFVGFIRGYNLYVVFWNADQHDRAIVIHCRSKRMDIVAEMPLTFETAHRLALFMPRAVPTTTLRRMRRQSNRAARPFSKLVRASNNQNCFVGRPLYVSECHDIRTATGGLWAAIPYFTA
ncbi:hypothetical protein ACFQX9_36735 [Bradyrhizobium sp. GCM10028915]|uniref:hypothetical protein n=1 Tax=Bradyrhizobium sp. GCM10028915 TaxID=3273385 RepID=UPI00361CE82C